MKPLRICGLAAVAAACVVGLLGVTTVQAALYTDSGRTVRYPTGTTIDLSLKSGSTSRLTNGGETIATCSESTAKGKTAGESGETIPLSLESLTWGGCSQTTDTLKTGQLEITWTGGGNGEVVGKESQWTVVVSGSSCTYGLGEGVKLGTLTGGETPTLKIEALVARTSGGIVCPSAVTWDSEYVVTDPHALYVGPILLTALYTDSSTTVKYPTGTSIDFSHKPGFSSKLTKGSETFATCTESTISGKTSNESGEAIAIAIESLTWGSCIWTTHVLKKGELEIKWTSGSTGEVVGKESQWTFSPSGVSCTYGFGAGTKLGTITGGSESALSVSTTIAKIAGGFLCPSTLGFDAEYILTSPHALYVNRVEPTTLFTDSAKTTRYTIGTVLDLSLTSGSTTRLTNGGTTIATCTESTAKGSVANSTGPTNTVNLASLTWGGCSQTTHTTKTGKLEIAWTSGSNGEVVGLEAAWTVGISGTSCSYGVGEGIKLGTLVSGETPTLKIEALVPRTGGGVLCPAAVTWDAEYVVTEPHALYVGT